MTYKPVLLGLFGIAMLTGCSLSSQSDINTQTSGQETNTQTATESAELNELKNSRPQRRADINGTVKKIVGNVYTVEYSDMSSLFGSGENQEDMRTRMQTMTDTQKSEYFQKMQEAREKAPKYTKDILIPAGIPILLTKGRGGMMGGGFGGMMGGTRSSSTNNGGSASSRSGGGSPTSGPGGGGFGPPPGGGGAAGGSASVAGSLGSSRSNEQKTASATMGSITDIKEGNTITIWIQTGSTDRVIAERVSVQQ